ncbi:MAG: hypothetical protein NTV23_13620 [Propionibacteriales bacterium]|nr:hypothetical protein [Propionibacteriales bacterium]
MRRLTLAVAAAALLVPAVLLGSSAAPAVGADSDEAGTAVTVQGTGRFSNLKVTVSKTDHLVNEVVHITWSGLKGGSGDNFPANYLQIMQCWGDEAAPVREKCQFGGLVDIRYGGFNAANRQVNGQVVDPLETITKAPGQPNAYVPFQSVTGVTEPNTPSQFFGGYTTNEQPFGRTASDGTGQDYFEVQTGREAPGLGCGSRLPSGAARDCWLAIVPRDNVEVDGNPSSTGTLNSSPLSQTNWNDKLAVRLHFDPVGITCPIGTAEKRLLGQEEVSEAIVRWQPKLCGETGSIFGFSQVSGDLARNKVLDDDPWLNFVSRPLDPATVPEGRPVTYAPVTISALGIAFNLDIIPSFGAPADVQAKRGQRVESMKLSPRLVAKLLTQSYLAGSYSPGMPPGNAIDMLRDPEFKELNPQLAKIKTETPLVSLLQPLGLADGHAELWGYINSDTDAVDFIKGKADPWGMKINPRYKNLSLDRSDFPRSDLGQLNLGDNGAGGTIEVQELDARPFAADMHEVARSAVKGDTLSRTQYDRLANPPVFKKDPPQVGGQRSILGITDLPTALRYSLPMVSLKNAAGKYVAPTSASIRAGLAQMKKSEVDGVLLSNPDATDPEAYPIPVITYAVTSPQQLPADDAKAYSAFLKYAAVKGQVPGIEQGKLPGGYVPLPAAMVEQTLAAAGLIARRGDRTNEPAAEPSATPTDTVVPPASSGPVALPGVVPVAGNGAPSKGPVAAPVLTGPVASPFTTPDNAAGPQRYLLLAALALGLAAGAFKPLTTWLYARKLAASPHTTGPSS